MNQPNADLSPLVVTRGFIPAPAGGGFGGPTWWPASEEIVVLYDPPGQRRLSSLDVYGLAPDGSRMRRLPLPTVPDCVSTIHLVPQVLPDGRLAYVEHCIGTNPRVPLHASRLMALDARTGRVEPLIPYGFHANMALYAFSPDQQRWIINDGQSLFESLEWLEADGPRRIDLPLERAGAPTWSPDGALIAVAGAPKGQSAQGVDRLDLSQRLYVFSPNDLKLRALAEGRPLKPWQRTERLVATTGTEGEAAGRVGERRA